MSDHENDLIEFLYQAIADTQGTIRATDVKVGFLLLIICGPVVAFDKVEPYLKTAFHGGVVEFWLTTASLIFWGLSAIAQIMTLFAISNPTTKIGGAKGKGVFFGGDLFQLRWWDVYANRSLCAKRQLADEVKQLPGTAEEIISELTYEKMKLGYIRAIKAERLNASVWLLIISVVMFLAAYCFHTTAP